MKKLLVLLFLLFSLTAHAQRREGAVWVVGFNRILDWNQSPMVIRDVYHQAFRRQTAVMCDDGGKLICYSNGIDIWDRTYSTMQGATEYFTKSYSGFRGYTDEALIPLMLNNRRKPDEISLFIALEAPGKRGLYLHRINKAGGNGFGFIDTIPAVINQDNMPFLTAMLHQDGERYWILTRQNNAPEWRSFLVNDTGVVRTPVISATGPDYPARPTGWLVQATDYVGSLSSSPNSELFVTNKYRWERDSTLVLYNFNRQTGQADKLFSIHFPTKVAAPAFSSNSKVLYVSEAGKSYWKSSFANPAAFRFLHNRAIYQVDLSQLDSQAVQNSVLVVGRSSIYDCPTGSLAVDGTIIYGEGYITDVGIKQKDTIDAVLYPNRVGLACSYQKAYRQTGSGVGAGGGFGLGFPFLNKTVFRNTWKLQATPSEDTCCLGDTVTLYAYGAEANNFVWDAHPQLLQTTGGAVKALATAPFTAWVTGSNPYSSNRASLTVEVVPKPSQPVLAWTHPDTVRILNPTPNTRYEWTENGVPIRTNGGTKQVATAARRYQVRAKRQAQCWSAWSQELITSHLLQLDIARLAKVYPNPATDILNIELPDGLPADEIVLTNTLGQEVLRQPVTGQTVEVPVTGLSRGVYFVRVKSGNVNGSPVKVVVR